jgi:hypothetical protein
MCQMVQSGTGGGHRAPDAARKLLLAGSSARISERRPEFNGAPEGTFGARRTAELLGMGGRDLETIATAHQDAILSPPQVRDVYR